MEEEETLPRSGTVEWCLVNTPSVPFAKGTSVAIYVHHKRDMISLMLALHRDGVQEKDCQSPPPPQHQNNIPKKYIF